ncbi:hypothetical protein A7C99_4712 [Trichophyton rubrum]|uniref:Dolichol-phosphate mannosyltransferase subunit 3 n=1 Tax=Trichophyton rubrum TaxID=5551 RepID=A0A178EVU1_TRIRU|nr:hypothetical protein A7C99_4712 [Trichophyton rubrum]
MTRAQQTLSVALLVTSLYLALYLGLLPLNQTIQEEIIPHVPIFSSGSAGEYSHSTTFQTHINPYKKK